VCAKLAATSRDAQNVEDEGLVHTLYANLAFCRVKQHRWAEVISACNEAIRLVPTYCKAILRRGMAKRMLKLWKEAVADANKAMRIAKEELEMGGEEKLNKDLIKEAQGLIDDVEKQTSKLKKDKERQEREEKGIELGDGDPIFGTDFDHVLRRELKRLLPEPIVWIEEKEQHKLGMCRGADDVPVDGPEFLVEASVRSRGAKRYLYYNIDIAVPWRGIMYESGKKPHWLHDQFHGVARIYGVNHYTDPENWGMFVTEKPVDPKDVPQCTPMGCPIEPMIPLQPDGSQANQPGKRCNETQELIFQKYGPNLVKKMKTRVEDAIEALRIYLGEYRMLSEEEKHKRKLLKDKRDQAEKAEAEAFSMAAARMNQEDEAKMTPEELKAKREEQAEERKAMEAQKKIDMREGNRGAEDQKLLTDISDSPRGVI